VSLTFINSANKAWLVARVGTPGKESGGSTPYIDGYLLRPGQNPL